MHICIERIIHISYICEKEIMCAFAKYFQVLLCILKDRKHQNTSNRANCANKKGERNI